jgi:uncharacterized protein (DUF305 family)
MQCDGRVDKIPTRNRHAAVHPRGALASTLLPRGVHVQTTKTRSLAAAAVGAAIAFAAVTPIALADGSSARTTTAATASPSPQPSTIVELRGEAEMPERIAPIDYEYAQALMQLPTEELEPTFMGEIVVHHAAVVEMSQIAMDKAAHPQIKTLAGAIIAAQTQQIEAFTQLLEREYGLTPEQAREQAPGDIPKILKEVNEHLEEKVETVREAPAGEQFDQIWLQEVIPHHQTAILEFQSVQAGAKLPQLVLMADMGINGQQGQIAQMLDFLIRWYGPGSAHSEEQVRIEPEGGADAGS